MSIDFEKKNILNEIVSLIFRAPYAKRHRALFLYYLTFKLAFSHASFPLWLCLTQSQ